MYSGYCYCCGKFVPPGFGHYERHWDGHNSHWRIKCVSCASNRVVIETDPEVKRALRLRQEREKAKCRLAQN